MENVVNLRTLPLDELLAFVDRSNPEVKELAQRLEDARRLMEDVHEEAESLFRMIDEILHGKDAE